MAYQEYTITTLADIPSIVQGFAADLGWDVQPGCILRHPNYNGAGPGGLAFQLTASSPSTVFRQLQWTCTTDAAKAAGIRSPIFGQPAAPATGVVQTPTKLFLIGMMEPEPYIAIVIEYGFNLYRHLYLGYMEKKGAYGGGITVASCNGPQVVVNGDIHYQDNRFNTWLFGAHNFSSRQNPAALCGGVLIEAAENSVPWRKFQGPENSSGGADADRDIANGQECFGGFGDGINDRYVAKGQNRIAGAVILTPINLYMSRIITGDFRLRGIGRPAGVRMVNIRDIEPQAQFDVGGENFYCFAARCKNGDLYSRRVSTLIGNQYRGTESSYYLGYAYRG